MTVLERVFEAALGIAIGALFAKNWRSLFGDDRRVFSRMFWQYGAVFGERLGAAVDRRMEAEQIDRRVFWGIAAALGAILSLRFMDVLAGEAFIALAVGILVLGLTIQTVTTKRRGVYRIAVLQPRDPARIVPLWLFVLPVIAWVFGAYAALHAHAVLTTGMALIASLVAFYGSYAIAAAPSIIGDQDPQMDAIVDLKIRAYRMRLVLLVGAIAPVMLAALVDHTNDWSRLAVVAAMLLLMWWSKLQSDFTASEVTTLLTSGATS